MLEWPLEMLLYEVWLLVNTSKFASLMKKKILCQKIKPLKKGITRACIHVQVHSHISTFIKHTPRYIHTREHYRTINT